VHQAGTNKQEGGGGWYSEYLRVLRDYELVFAQKSTSVAFECNTMNFIAFDWLLTGL
jgi:hypothetical protein